MDNRTLNLVGIAAGIGCGALAVALLIPKSRQKLVDFAEEMVPELDDIEPGEVIVSAAKTALSEGRKEAFKRTKEQLDKTDTSSLHESGEEFKTNPT